MAGWGSRFGSNIFKPFLLATEETFIEWAVKPFPQDAHFYFIYRQTQEDTYQVSQKLKELFPTRTITPIIITQDTIGPLQTIQAAHLSGPSFVCDCDHSIDITPMLPHLQNQTILIPTWDIQEADYPNWGKVQVDPTSHPIAFAEKEYLPNAKGMIGCYFFPDIALLSTYPPEENISNALRRMHQDHIPMQIVPIQHANFFGTPQALQQFRYKRAQKHTFLIDIDGTLLHQTTKELLPQALTKLLYWKAKGHTIVLTTASPQPTLPPEVPYDYLLTNLPPGRRILINDLKPYLPYYEMATAYNLLRNQGPSSIEIPDTTPEIVATFAGASFATVYLIKDNTTLKVRKFAIKQPELLQRQYEDLQRLSYYAPTLFPTLYTSYKTHTYFYYDMEYYPQHQPLSNFSPTVQKNTTKKVLADLEEQVYVYAKPLPLLHKTNWITTFMQEKIAPKQALLSQIYPTNQLYTLLNQLDLTSFAPDYLSPIHGDLTLENILYDPHTQTYKLIDPAGSRYVDAKEMDIGKLFQSLLTDYKNWDKHLQHNTKITHDYAYVQDLFTPEAYRKGVFYMTTYFIRMTPFMLEKSKEQTLYMLELAEHYLKTIIVS
jgi:hypothetical protein